MKWGVWYIHPLVGFAATGWLSRSGTNRDQRPHTPPNCSPTPPHRLRTPSGVRIRRVPEGSLHSFCQRLTAQAREPAPNPALGTLPPRAPPRSKPHRPSTPHTPTLLGFLRCALCLLVCLVGCLGFVGCLVCGGCMGAASGGHGAIRGRSWANGAIRSIDRTLACGYLPSKMPRYSPGSNCCIAMNAANICSIFRHRGLRRLLLAGCEP